MSSIDYAGLENYAGEQIVARFYEIRTKKLGQEGINYWQSKIEEFSKLSREEAIRVLIKSQKIEQKIYTIERAISRKYTI